MQPLCRQFGGFLEEGFFLVYQAKVPRPLSGGLPCHCDSLRHALMQYAMRVGTAEALMA